MKTIDSILEALLINSNADFKESDPNVEFKVIYDALQRINQSSKTDKEGVLNFIRGFNTPFTFCEEDKEALINEIESI